MIHMYNYMIENTNPDCRVNGSCRTVQPTGIFVAVYNSAKNDSMSGFYTYCLLYNIINNFYSFSQQINTWEMIYMYNDMIENTNPDWGVLGSCQTIHVQESTVFAKLVLLCDFTFI